MLNPSFKSVPNARPYANAKSIPSPVYIAWTLASKIFFIDGWGLKVEGIFVIAFPTDCKISLSTPVF